MTTPHTPPAALLDVAAIEARAAAATAVRALPAGSLYVEHSLSAADVPALLAALRAERAQHAADVAAAVAAETRRCIDACKHVASQCPAEDDRDLALTCAEAIEVDAPPGGGE